MCVVKAGSDLAGDWVHFASPWYDLQGSGLVGVPYRVTGGGFVHACEDGGGGRFGESLPSGAFFFFFQVEIS